jgi:MFS family permease
VFVVFAAPPVLAALLLWRLVSEPPHATAPPDPAWPFRRVLATPAFWLLGLAGITPVYVQFLLATWGPLLFAEVGITDLGRSASLASLQGIVAPLGLLASGLAADRLHQRGLHRKLVMAAALILMAASMALTGFAVRWGGPPWLLTLSVLAASFFLWANWGPAYAIFGGLFPPSVLGKAFGLYNSVCFLGAVASPYLTGWIRDLTGSFAAGLFLAAVLPAASLAAALSLPPAFRLRGAPALAARRGA